VAGLLQPRGVGSAPLESTNRVRQELEQYGAGRRAGLHFWSVPVYAPSCQTCLRIASSRLESRPADDRIPLIVALAMQEFWSVARATYIFYIS